MSPAASAPAPATTGFQNVRSKGSIRSRTHTSTTVRTFTTDTASAEAVAAPVTPQRGMSAALVLSSRTVHSTEFASFMREWPVMSRTAPQTPVPAFTSSPTVMITSAVAAEANASPKMPMSGSAYSNTTTKKGMFRLSVHRVDATYRPVSPRRSPRSWSRAATGLTATMMDSNATWPTRFTLCTTA
jgi:hypothetical protein